MSTSARHASGVTAACWLIVILVTIGVVVIALKRHAPNDAPGIGGAAPVVPQSIAAPVVPSSMPTTKHGAVTIRPMSSTRHLQTLEYPHFTIGYDNDRKNPAYVTYELDGPISTSGPEPARPTFATEFRTSAHVSSSDYTNSGFDRGHLCPAYAMFSRWGAAGFTETFVMSNVIPQPHAVNAGIWEDMEANIAGRAGHGGGWAESLGHITIINGPIYDDHAEQLRTGVTVPAQCFSVILDYQEDGTGYKAIAVVVPNQGKPTGPLRRWLTSIRSIERQTGLDLLAGMDAAIRATIEDAKADEVWLGSLHP